VDVLCQERDFEGFKTTTFLTNSLALMKEYRSPGIDTIQNYLTKHNQDPHCQFVLRLFDKLPILKDLRTILTSIKNLGYGSQESIRYEVDQRTGEE
jgi:hypothetical protein